jgi:uncharacterized protein
MLTTATTREGVSARRETLTVRVAFGLIALHIVDDAFVHPEPGTAAGDHLVSGLVPTAVIALLALAYPRMRAGLRSCIALACGLVAVVVGIGTSFRHVVIDGPAGDDASGILATLGAIALVATAVVTLWRTRRADEPRARRYLRRGLATATFGAAGLFVIAPIGMAVLATNKARAPVEAADLGRPYERVSFTTSDGLELKGWYVPSRNRAAVVGFPGRTGTVTRARMLARHGYGVLLFDRRGEGESEGDINLFGWGGEPDLHAALAFLRNRPDVDPARIGGLGLSVGGEMLLQTAAHTPDLRAVVSEGAGYRSSAEQQHLAGALWWLSPVTALTGATAVLADEGPPPDLASLVGRIAPRPILLIYAKDGNGGEAELNPLYHRRAGAPKALWALERGGHTGGYAADPAEYERRVVAFFDRALLSAASAADYGPETGAERR